MNETDFLESYADTRLKMWWETSTPALRDQMLELITKLNKTPLAQLDQFTVGLHTNQPDDWQGSRLVFAINNNLNATKESFCLSLALRPETITASISHELKPLGRSVARWSASVKEILEWLEGLDQQIFQNVVDQKLELRRVDGRPTQRCARRPCDYN